MSEGKSKKRNDCRSNDKHQNGNKSESQKSNDDNKGKGNCTKKNEIEAVSCTPQTRKRRELRKN